MYKLKRKIDSLCPENMTLDTISIGNNATTVFIFPFEQIFATFFAHSQIAEVLDTYRHEFQREDQGDIFSGSLYRGNGLD
jgi:hypothetical protein